MNLALSNCELEINEKKTLKSFSNRIMSHEGGMNPEFGMVDIVPDDDLNTRLKFYVSSTR